MFSLHKALAAMVLALSVILCSVVIASAEPLPSDATALQQRVTELETQVSSLKSQQDDYQFLKEELKDFRDRMDTEAQNHREFLERERDHYEAYLERMLTLAGTIGSILIALFLGITSWFGFKTLKDVKNEVSDVAKKRIAGIVDAEIHDVQERVEVLQHLVERELSFTRARVAVLGRTGDLEHMRDHELRAVKERGLRDLRYMADPIPLEVLARMAKNREVDVVVFRFDPSGADKQDERVRQVAHTLHESGSPVPLLIYTYQRGQVIGEDKQAVEEYLWSNFANSPTTLISTMFMLANVFLAGGATNDRSSVS